MRSRTYSAETLEARLFLSSARQPDPPDLSPLTISNLVFANNQWTATDPTISVNGTATVSLQGMVTLTATLIQATGQVRATFGNTQLLFGGDFSIPIGTAATNALTDTLGDVADRLQLGGTKLMFANLTLAAGSVSFDATATLPPALGSYTLSATGVSFDSTGVTAATLGIADPAVYMLNLGGFRLNASQLSAVYDVPNQRLKFQGMFNAPQLNTTVNLTGNKFLAVSAGPAIDFVGGVSINGPVNLGGPWKLNSLDVTIAYQNSSFTTSGTAVIDTGGGTINLQASFANNSFSFSLQASAMFQLLGMTCTISSLTFTSDQSGGGAWDPRLTLQGSVQLPQQFGNFTVAIDGSNMLVVDSSGVTVSGATLSLPGNQTFVILNLLEIRTQNATLAFDFNQSEMTLTGTYIIPTLNNVQINLSGANFAKLRYQNNSLDFAMTGSFTNIMFPIFGSWSLQNGMVSINKPYGAAGNVNGTFEIKTPNNTTIAVTMAFLDGRLDRVTAMNNNPNPDFTFFGVSASVRNLVFIPDINTGNDDAFEPQLELQGSVAFPLSFGNVVAGGPVTFEVANPEKFILNESGLSLTGGTISIPSITFNLLNLVRVDAQSLVIKYISAPTQSLRVSGIVKIPQLFNIELNFDPALNRFIQFDSAGTVTVNGQITVSNINIVPNLWVIREATFLFNNTGGGNIFEVGAKIQIPSGNTISGKIRFVDSALDEIRLGATFTNPGIALGATGVFLTRVDAGMQNLANPTGNPPLRVSGGFGLSFGPSISISLPGYLGGPRSGAIIDLDMNGFVDRNQIDISGGVAVIGNAQAQQGLLTGNGHLNLNWSQGLLTGQINLNLFGGIFTGMGDFKAASSGVMSFTGTGMVKIPSALNPLPIGDVELGSGTGVLYYTNNGTSSDDFVAAWANLPGFGLAGAKISFDGSVSLVRNAITIPPISTTTQEARYQIDSNAPGFIVSAHWSNSIQPNSIRVEFLDPGTMQPVDVTAPGNGIVDTTTITPGSFPKRVIRLDGIHRTGTYIFTLIPPAGQQFADTSWDGARANIAPTVAPTNATVAAPAEVTVNYTAADPDDQAKVTWFVDDNNTGLDGRQIPVYFNNTRQFEVIEQDGPGAVIWKAAERIGASFYVVPNGTYYLYARIQDGVNAPVFAYLNDPVTVTTNNLPHIVAVYADSTQWSPAFYNSLAARSIGGPLGFRVTTAGVINPAPVPFGNVNRINIEMSAPVDFLQGAVSLALPSTVPYAVDQDVTAQAVSITAANSDLIRKYLAQIANNGMFGLFDGLLFDGDNNGVGGDGASLVVRNFGGDVNRDGQVNIFDFASMAVGFGLNSFHPQYNPMVDFNGNGFVEIGDFAFLAADFNSLGPPPADVPEQTLSRPAAAFSTRQIDQSSTHDELAAILSQN